MQVPKVRTPEEIAARKERRRVTAQKWREANREKAKAATRRWQNANPEKMAAQARRWRAANPEKERKTYRLRRLKAYGITAEDFTRMLAEQDNRCAICGNVFSGPKHTHIDHSHVTGQVRALLCSHCNPGLGHFHDDPVLLQRAIDYLRRFMK
jgi:recombination endonuclease VII